MPRPETQASSGPYGDAYAWVAPWYDAVTGLALARARERITALCRERGFQSVLDIGCGTGAQLALLHAAGVACLGVDHSPAMLAVARKRLGASVPLARASVPLPFGSAGFDAALLSLVLHETEAPGGAEAVLAEALRVAPMVLVLEWRMPERNLDLPMQLPVHVVERLAGKSHYAHFRDFARKGWLHGLAARCGCRVAHEEAMALRSLVLALVSVA